MTFFSFRRIGVFNFYWSQKGFHGIDQGITSIIRIRKPFSRVKDIIFYIGKISGKDQMVLVEYFIVQINGPFYKAIAR